MQSFCVLSGVYDLGGNSLTRRNSNTFQRSITFSIFVPVFFDLMDRRMTIGI
mgnify:CR=1 FL=1